MTALAHYPGPLVDGALFASVAADAIRYKALADAATGLISHDAARDLIDGSTAAANEKMQRVSVQLIIARNEAQMIEVKA